MNEIYSALISGVFSLIVGFIGLFAGRKDTKSISQKRILEAQLSNVLEPMVKLLTISRPCGPLEPLNSLMDIVSSNYKLVPKQILCEINVLREKERPCTSDFHKLSIIVSSYYNWTCRYLGYPYDRSQIKMEYTHNSLIKIVLVTVSNIIVLLLYCFSALVLFAYFRAFFRGSPSVIPAWMLACCSYFLLLCVTWVLFSQFHRK